MNRNSPKLHRLDHFQGDLFQPVSSATRDADRYTELSVFRYRYGIPTIPNRYRYRTETDFRQMSPYRHRTDTEPIPNRYRLTNQSVQSRFKIGIKPTVFCRFFVGFLSVFVGSCRFYINFIKKFEDFRNSSSDF